MIILGVNGGTKFETDEDPIGYAAHDAAAVLIQDGNIVAAIEEERLSRIKHSNCFPARAIGSCLRISGAHLSDIDIIATNLSQPGADFAEMWEFWVDPSVGPLTDGRHRFNRPFEHAFGINILEKARFCPHHLAHAWSAFAPSGFDRSLILSVDGEGENTSGMVLTARENKISVLREYPLVQSLGNLYTQFIRLLGYSRFDEYKVMGLAPYGDPNKYAQEVAKLYHLLPNGDYRLVSGTELLARLSGAGLFKVARREAAPFSQCHMDLAAALQSTLETIVLHILSHFRKTTGEVNLCLAGGVAHNCTMNAKILGSGMFNRVFVQPAAHDAGTALGAAWWAYYGESSKSARPKLRHLYYGTDVGDSNDICAELTKWSEFVTFKEVADVIQFAARLLADGHVLGWVQGRSEFGPRALGNRSILADPRPADNKRLINDMVKKREAYRPFAPSAPEECASKYFDLPKDHPRLPFMVVVVPVRPEWRTVLGAVTHVDGTARLQTVSKDENQLFWNLLTQFGKITGIPILLNTSFNNNAEPIVDSVRDAITCFLTTNIEYLCIGRFLVTKRALNSQMSEYRKLTLDLASNRRLVKRKTFGSGENFRIENIKSRHFGRSGIQLSRELFGILAHASGNKTIASLLRELAVEEESLKDRIVGEILELWSQRLVVLQPLNVSESTDVPNGDNRISDSVHDC